MKMVLEEIEGKTACLIPDDVHFPSAYIDIKKLPTGSRVGDVFEVEVELPSFEPVRIVKIEGEKEERLKKMKAKRERLLRRSKNRNQR